MIAREVRSVELPMNTADAAHVRGKRSCLALLRTAWREYEHDYAHYFAGAIVYYALVSLLPLILLLLAVLGLSLRLTDVAADAERQVLEAVETHFGAELRTTLQDLLQRLEHGSIVATFVSFVGLSYAASKLFRHLRLTFRAVWKRAPLLTSGFRSALRATLLERAIAFAMVLAGGAFLVLAFVLLALLHWLAGFLSHIPLFNNAIGYFAAIVTPIAITFVTFALLFKALPPVHLRWRDVWLATVLCAVAWLVGAEVLALYVKYFGGRFSAYGVIGGVLILMLWMHAMSKVLFFGAEICKVGVSVRRA